MVGTAEERGKAKTELKALDDRKVKARRVVTSFHIGESSQEELL